MNDIITKEQVIAAYNNAPDLVRAMFNDEKTTQVLVELEKKLQLNPVEAGTLGKEVGYLLLGIIDPNKFVSRLKNANFSDQTINEITSEINQKIFIPLREEMKSGATTGQAYPTPAPQPITRPVAPPPVPQSRVVPTPMPQYVPPPAPRPIAPITPPPPPAPRPMPRPQPSAPPPVTAKPAPQTFPSPWASAPSSMIQANPALPTRPSQAVSSVLKRTSVPATPKPPVVAAHYMQPRPTPTAPPARMSPIHAPGQTINIVINSAARMLEDHEEPHIEFNSRPAISRRSAPPLNLPGAMPPLEQRLAPPAPPVPRPPARQETRPPAVEHYDSDPYHEPIDDLPAE